MYVNCSAVRGDENILVDVGRQITYSDRITHQLYTGHRGAGKSTELLRLKDALEKDGYRVVYFAAEEADIDPEDAQYTDILLACTRNLLKDLRGNQQPIQQWLTSRKTELVDAMQSEVGFDSLDVEVPFSKLTTTLKVSPTEKSSSRPIAGISHSPPSNAPNTVPTVFPAQTSPSRLPTVACPCATTRAPTGNAAPIKNVGPIITTVALANMTACHSGKASSDLASTDFASKKSHGTSR